MVYILNRAPRAGGDDIHVRDAEGRDRFLIDGKAFRLGNQLALRDPEGRELAAIRQRLFALRRTFEIHRDGELWATARKELFAFFRTRFAVDVASTGARDDYTAVGDFEEHEYTIARLRHGEVARVSRELADDSDSFGVEIAGGEDEILILAVVVVVDLVSQARADSAFGRGVDASRDD